MGEFYGDAAHPRGRGRISDPHAARGHAGGARLRAWPPPSAPSPKREFAAEAGDFDVAILDVNLDGEEVFPVAEILAQRGLPFVFVTGYGERSLAEPYGNRPALQKPFQSEQLKNTLADLLAPA